MNESNVIREFLVALGFKMDEPALKKFETGIARATTVVMSLGVAVEATAISIGYGVAKFSSNLEGLYFASVKTGASATNLRAFERAARDFGVASGEASASVQNLAHFLRVNPGGEAALGSWFGVNTRDANGKELDRVDLLMKIGEGMRKMSLQQAIYRGGLAGISEDTVRMLVAGGDNYAKVLDRLKRAGFDDAATKAHAFMVSLRRLQDQLVIFGVRVYDVLQKKLKISLDGITDWMSQNGPWLADRVAYYAGLIVDDFNSIVTWLHAHGPEIRKMIGDALGQVHDTYLLIRPAIVWIFDRFKDLDAATDGWSTRLIVMLGLLKAVGALDIGLGILGLAAAFGKLAVAITGLSAGPIIATLGTITGMATAIGAAYGAYELYRSYKEDDEKGGGPRETTLAQRLQDWLTGVLGGPRDRAQMALDGTHSGFSFAQIQGMLDTLQAESGLDPHKEGDFVNGVPQAYGIAQWHQPGQDEFKRWSGGMDIRGSNIDKQIEFLAYQLTQGSEAKAGALLRAADSEPNAIRTMVRGFERPKDPDGEIARALNFSQNVTIHVDGSKDPRATAAAVEERMNRLTQAVTRTFASSVN